MLSKVMIRQAGSEAIYRAQYIEPLIVTSCAAGPNDLTTRCYFEMTTL
jgi:hypothetical protein